MKIITVLLLLFILIINCNSKVFSFIEQESELEGCFKEFINMDTNKDGFLEKHEFEIGVFSQLSEILEDYQMQILVDEAYKETEKKDILSVSEKCKEQFLKESEEKKKYLK